jgi:hypothetical protein
MFGWLNGNSTAMNVLAALADLSFIVYIPAVLLELRQANRAELRGQRREREARKNEIYTQLIQSYIDWQKLCLDHLDLDIAGDPDEGPSELSPPQIKRERIALEILIQIFEQAFLAYLDAPEELRTFQWKGWELYIDDYCRKANFRQAWQLSGPNMDQRFASFMDAKMLAGPKTPA